MTRARSKHPNRFRQQGHERDRAVRRAGRVRAALVGGATAASVGIAGVLGLTALTSSSSASPATPAHRSPATRQPQNQPQKTSLIADLHTFGSGQPVSSGSGSGNGGSTSTHVTTKGS